MRIEWTRDYTTELAQDAEIDASACRERIQEINASIGDKDLERLGDVDRSLLSALTDSGGEERA